MDEVEVPTGYTKTVTPSKDKYSYTITNSHETEKVKVSVLKIWDDKDNQDGKQPDSVTVQLKDGSGNVGDPVTLNKDNQWSHEWTGLDKYKNGTLIIYSVDEAQVPAGYTKNVTFEKDSAGNYSYTISNKHETEKIKVSVEKIWDDEENQDGMQPTSISVQLKADGANVGDPVTLSEENSWAYAWNNLDKYKDGKEIVYSVEETSVPDGYKNTVTFEKDDAGNFGYTLTNKHETGNGKTTRIRMVSVLTVSAYS